MKNIKRGKIIAYLMTLSGRDIITLHNLATIGNDVYMNSDGIFSIFGNTTDAVKAATSGNYRFTDKYVMYDKKKKVLNSSNSVYGFIDLGALRDAINIDPKKFGIKLTGKPILNGIEHDDIHSDVRHSELRQHLINEGIMLIGHLVANGKISDDPLTFAIDGDMDGWDGSYLYESEEDYLNDCKVLQLEGDGDYAE